jgi:hypothetical protein
MRFRKLQYRLYAVERVSEIVCSLCSHVNALFLVLAEEGWLSAQSEDRKE